MKINTSKYRKTLLTGCVALLSTLSGTTHAAGGQIYHTIGAPALSVSNLSESGGLLFEVRFEPASVVGAEGTLIVNPYAFEGDILARSVAADGSFTPDDYYPSDPDDAGYIEGLAGKIQNFNGLWRGSETVTAQSKRGVSADNRVIFTSGYDAGGDIGYPFRWSELSDALKGPINSDTGVNEASDPVTDWTRGHDTNEGTGATNFRQRTTVLGNFVHVTPAYLGAPFGFFPNDADYGQFVTDNQARTPLVFAGDGAGLMHAFKAVDGTEVFAYIPQEILGSLKTLTQQTSEIFLVDGSPTVGDAKGTFPKCNAGDCWRTVLVSGLGVGGSTIFALDVTNPVSDIGELSDKESNAAELFLWEFTDADLGLTTADPIIAQLSDGTWAAIFGNGQGADKAVLYVVDIADGSLIQKLIVSTTGSGLSSPVAWDLDYDGDIDIVYAGDPEGNLWKLDFTSADVNGNATIAFSDNSLVQVIDPVTSNPLPINTKPLVSINPDGGLLVFFGTGMSNQDIGDTNALFGIQDKGARITNLTLIESVLSEPILYDPVDPNEPNKKYRVIKEYTAPGTTSVGWKLVLPTGERILTNPILNNERVGFTSTDPTAATFNQNWFTAVDYQTGGPPDTAFLDLNNDGIFNDDDLFRDLDGECPIDDETCIANSDSAIAVGVFLDIGVVSAPTPANISGQKDTVFITHGLESIFDTPLEDELFNDPGIRAGHIDHDTFEEENGSLRDHTHEYDDKYNVNGVNMLVSGGQVLHPPDSFIWNGDPPGQTPVESATGMMSGDKALMDHVLELDDAENTLVRLEIINPYSYDTPLLAERRCNRGVDFLDLFEAQQCAQAAPAEPVTIWYKCAGTGINFVGPAPDFNMLDDSDRTCRAGDITHLISKVTNINALRAMESGCARNGTVYTPPSEFYIPGNTGYRGGAFTVQAWFASNGDDNYDAVFHEDVIYEHITGNSIDKSALATTPDEELLNNRNTSSTFCDALNEDLRAFKDPDFFGDAGGYEDPPDEPGPTGVTTSGTQLTETINVDQLGVGDGRVNWREVLD